MKIIVRNATSQIETTEDILSEYRSYLSYEVQGANFAMAASPYWDGRVKLMKRDGSFPTGLLKFVIKHAKEQGIKYTLHDDRYVPTPSLKLKATFPDWWEVRPYQVDAVKASGEYPRGVFVMGTGAGKSGTSAMLVESKQVPTLIVTPDVGLRTQLTDDYIEWFGSKNVSNDIKSDKPIIISNIQALTNKPRELFKRFELLIIDEFHHSAAKTYKELNIMCANAYYRYGFTGTFVRPDGSDLEMFGVLSNVIFTKTTSELIEEGYLVRPYITMACYEIKDDRGKKLRMNYKDAYKYATMHIGLNNVIADWANAKIKEGKQTIVLVRFKEHGELLARLIPDAIYLNGDHKSDHREKVKKLFNQRKIKCMIATSIFGEGQNIPSIDCFANARFQKTEIQTMQGIGRCLRKIDGKDKAEVLDILITGQRNLEDHSIERLNSYRKEKAFRINVRRA
jgi:superfamily II DNA or RNA helicase